MNWSGQPEPPHGFRRAHPRSDGPSPTRFPPGNRCPPSRIGCTSARRPSTRHRRAGDGGRGARRARSAPARSRWPRPSPTRWTDGRHLLVQAGTGTGKSLAYLVPGAAPRPAGRGRDRHPGAPAPARRARHPARWSRRSTHAHPEVDTSYAVLKGRSNYACLHRIREGVPDDQGALVEVPDGLDGHRRCSSCGRGPRRRPRPSGSGERDHAPAAHRPRVAAGQRQPPRVPRRGASARSARSASPSVAREKAAPLPPDRHQPLAARHRRDRGRADDPRLRRRGGRRGPRARPPGSPRPPPTSCSPPTSTGRAPRRAASGHVDGSPRPTTSPTPATRCAPRSRECRAGPLRRRCPRRSPTRWCWSATPPAPASRRTPRRATPAERRRRPHPGPRLGAGGLRHRRADGRRLRRRRALADRARASRGGRRGSASRRCRSGARCATSCSPTRPWCSPRATLMLGGDFDAVATSVGLKPAERVDTHHR